MEFINLGNMLVALVITLALMVSHYLSPLISKIPGAGERRITSFAGGFAVAYVFLHMLPELVEGNAAIGEALKEVVPLTPLLDLGIFLLALFGFTVYYGLELLAQKSAQQGGQATMRVYHLHLFMYCLYNFMITYTMPLRVQTGVFYAVIFTVAMGLHFILSDRNFNRHFHEQFSLGGASAALGLLGRRLAGHCPHRAHQRGAGQPDDRLSIRLHPLQRVQGGAARGGKLLLSVVHHRNGPGHRTVGYRTTGAARGHPRVGLGLGYSRGLAGGQLGGGLGARRHDQAIAHGQHPAGVGRAVRAVGDHDNGHALFAQMLQ